RSKKLDEKLDKIGEKLGGVESNIGFHAEQFFQNTLAETLTFGNEKYEDIYPNLKSMKKNADVEFDIVLVNGESVAIIEVKNRIHPKFVKDLVEKRLAMFRKTFSLFQNHKAYLGIAGFSFDDAVIKEAKEYGVGIIKQVGESIEAETGHLKAY
ncbi:MAG: hypothetical protein LBU70_03905, partial [Chitinispirillales bacterium]|nr:hypothetical protein [Chitinispirillales bacterium]